MTASTDAAENGLALLLFNNVDFAGIGDAAGLQNSAAAGSYYLSIHTADPGEAGDQDTDEIDYTGYARVAVARTAGGWTVVGNNITNTADTTWGEMTAGTGGTGRYIGIGTDATGPGTLLWRLPASPTLVIGDGVIPELEAGEISLDIN